MRACAACACGSVGGSFVSSSETEVASPRTKRNARGENFLSQSQKLPRQADVEKTRRAPACLRVASLPRARSRAFLARFTFSRLAFPRAHALARAHAPALHKEAFPPPAVSSPKAHESSRRPRREIRPRREEDPAVSRCPPCFATCSPAWRGPTQRRGWCTTTPSGTSRS